MSKNRPPLGSERSYRAKRSIHVVAAIEILRAADRVKRSAAQVIAPHGLTLSQYNALRILRGAPEGLSTMELCRRLLERSPGITRIVDGLVKKGLAQRIPHTSDRRSILCAITEAGRTMADALDEPIDRSDRELTKDLAAAEVKQLAELLCRVGNHDG